MLHIRLQHLNLNFIHKLKLKCCSEEYHSIFQTFSPGVLTFQKYSYDKDKNSKLWALTNFPVNKQRLNWTILDSPAVISLLVSVIVSTFSLQNPILDLNLRFLLLGFVLNYISFGMVFSHYWLIKWVHANCVVRKCTSWMYLRA